MSSTQPPEFEKLLEIYKQLAQVGDPICLQFELDRSYQLARKQCGMRSLAAFKAGFTAYLEQQKGGTAS